MFGHVARHPRRWPWVTLSFLFAAAFAWSFAVTAERVDVGWSILRVASAAGLGLSLLRLVLMFVSSRRVRRRPDEERRAQNSEAAVTATEGPPSTEALPTDGRGPTYEEVFGQDLDLDEDLELGGGRLPLPPDEVDLQSSHADPDAAVDRVEAVDADVGSQERLRQIREQFKARAEAASLRVKQREAELQKAATTPDAER